MLQNQSEWLWHQFIQTNPSPPPLHLSTITKGQRVWEGPPQYLDSIADGIRLQQTGYITTPILIDLAEKEVFEMVCLNYWKKGLIVGSHFF